MHVWSRQLSVLTATSEDTICHKLIRLGLLEEEVGQLKINAPSSSKLEFDLLEESPLIEESA
jgi:hypothetical protein